MGVPVGDETALSSSVSSRTYTFIRNKRLERRLPGSSPDQVPGRKCLFTGMGDFEKLFEKKCTGLGARFGEAPGFLVALAAWLVS